MVGMRARGSCKIVCKLYKPYFAYDIHPIPFQISPYPLSDIPRATLHREVVFLQRAQLAARLALLSASAMLTLQVGEPGFGFVSQAVSPPKRLLSQAISPPKRSPACRSRSPTFAQPSLLASRQVRPPKPPGRTQRPSPRLSRLLRPRDPRQRKRPRRSVRGSSPPIWRCALYPLWEKNAVHPLSFHHHAVVVLSQALSQLAVVLESWSSFVEEKGGAVKAGSVAAAAVEAHDAVKKILSAGSIKDMAASVVSLARSALGETLSLHEQTMQAVHIMEFEFPQVPQSLSKA